MKRFSDMTIRERGRWFHRRQAFSCIGILILGLYFQNWWIVAGALVCGVLVYFGWRDLEKRTRDDPPHANY
ncbi:hypothetical protein GCM10010977_22180 [Citricoccus zhacaiensis]|uniref:Uncharacterized protein n=1 Tax=Citricoccus zhacaiensis TaxID=489142 RepID=A0ABQ2M462_9MICC|nr:hypothetical protein [Citricoccus zhacaiensis]GGO46675.1 hypothetical protein GCM10010977_22180 [Citricoccus zhacaiensis]